MKTYNHYCKKCKSEQKMFISKMCRQRGVRLQCWNCLTLTHWINLKLLGEKEENEPN